MFPKRSTALDENENSEEFENELLLLQEAAAFFSASLNSDEMRVLLCSRIASLLNDCMVGVAVPTETGFLLKDSDIPDIPLTRDLIEVTSLGNQVVTVEDLQRKNDSFDLFLAAVPLLRGKKLLGVLVVSPITGAELPSSDKLRSIADVAGPLLSGAQNFEASASSALRDTLTDLPNERAMEVILEQQIAESERYGFERKLSVLVVDLEGFDVFNSSYGHVEGDRLISHASFVLSECVRKMDYVSRISSDEFVVIMPKLDKKALNIVVERVEQAFAEQTYVTRSGDAHRISIKFGVAVYGEDAFDGDGLIKVALEKKRLAKKTESGDVLIFPVPTGANDQPIA